MPRTLALVLAALAVSASAQRYPVRSLQAAEGVGAVNAVAPAHVGVWLGTVDGLLRYDGARVIAEPLPVVASQGVLDVVPTPERHLWIWAPPHLLLRSPRGDVRRVEVPDALRAPLATERLNRLNLLPLPGGRLLLGTPDDGLWLRQANGWRRLLGDRILDLAADDDRIWVLTRTRLGTAPLSAPSAVRWQREAVRQGLHVLPHPEGAWLTTHRGLYLARPDGRRQTVLGDSVRCWFARPDVRPDGTLALTIETDRVRLAVVSPDGHVRLRVGPAQGLATLALSRIWFDADGGLLLASQRGLDYLEDTDRIQAFAIGGGTFGIAQFVVHPVDGSIWIKTYGGGLFRHDGRQVLTVVPENAPDGQPSTLSPQNDGSMLWLSRQGGASTTWRSDGYGAEPIGTRPFELTALAPGFRVLPSAPGQIIDGKGKVIASTGGWIAPSPAPPPGVRPWFAIEERIESIEGDGLASRSRDAPADVRAILDRYRDWVVTAVAYDGAGRAWVGTHQGVVVLHEAGGTWQAEEMAAHDPDLGADVGGLTALGDAITVATLRGVRRYRVGPGPTDLTPIALPGLGSVLHTRAAYRVAETMGALWVVPHGPPVLVRYRAGAALEVPAVRLSQVRVNGRDVPLPDAVRSDTARIELAFAPATLRRLADLAVEYRVDGSRWQRFAGEPTLRFEALAPGRHTVEARAVRPGQAPGPILTVPLRAVPPFYRAGWFLTLLGLAAGAVLAVFVRRRLRAGEVRKRELEATVAERTVALTASLETVESQARRLVELDAAKGRFFAAVSHELRTPLTLLLGPIRDALDGRAPLQDHLPAMRRNGERLLRLIDHLLDIARLESATLRLDRQPTDLGRYVEAVVAAFGSRAAHENIELTCDTAEGIVADVDRDRVERIVFNLVENALRHTPSGGSVRVTVEADGDEAILTVADTGEGIPPEVGRRVFERFRQVEDSTRVHGALGLGLSLVREWAEAHDGTADVESAPDAGTRFTVRLPLAVPDVEPEPLDDDRPGQPEAPADVAAMPDTPQASDDAPLVLLVEDHDDVRAYVRDRIAPHYRVAEAADGLSGLDAARRLRPDLVVSDVMMPRIDGVELCRTLRADPRLGTTPVILLTARADEAVLLDGLGVGADDVLAKPFHTDELLLRIENLIEVRRRLQARVAEPIPAAEESDLVTEATAAVERHLANPDLTVEWLAAELATSARTLQRRLKAEAGLSPGAFIRSVRLERAHARLRAGAASVAEVADGVGYRDPSYFARAFRQVYGVAPSGVAEEG